MDNSRRLALESLIRAEASACYSNLEINNTISKSDMSKIDISLYTALYLGVTEKLLTLNYLISKYSKIPLKELDAVTRNALRLGFYQLLYMDKIPDYSAVSETVNLCPFKSKGFANACLRSFIRNGKELVLPEDKWQAISIKSSIPMDILEIFRKSYGDETAEKLSEAKPRAGVSIRINSLKIEPPALRSILKERRISYSHVGLSEELLLVKAPISEIMDLIDKGLCFVQDPSSYACVEVLAPKSGDNVLDACACPGGKSFSSAIEMKNQGMIASCDLHKNKLSLVQKGASRLGIDIIKVMEQDAKNAREEFIEKFDKVLCDVPCSGLGVIAKKPDIKYKPLEQISSLPDIQLEILMNCSKYVKLGGELVYSTCTLNASENEKLVNRFISKNSRFEFVDFELHEIKSTEGKFTFMPHINDCDGFFVAKMKRVK